MSLSPLRTLSIFLAWACCPEPFGRLRCVEPVAVCVELVATCVEPLALDDEAAGDSSGWASDSTHSVACRFVSPGVHSGSMHGKLPGASGCFRVLPGRRESLQSSSII
jgi:hypothetical protein